MDTKNQKNLEEPEVNKSKLFIKSIGYAAVNLELGSKELEVFPAEEFGYTDGEITDERETLEEGGIDAKGNSYIDSIETSNTLLASWMPFVSNRHTAPNVRRGERVILLQYADDDKYYWTTMGLDEHLRRRETIIYHISNTTDESTTALNSDNSYSIIFSTHTKEITLQTTKSDGEPFYYILKIDTKNGLFVVTDDINNQISIESEAKRITLVNADGASVTLDKKNINLDAPDTITMKAKSIVTISDTHSITSNTYVNNSSKYNVLGSSNFTGTITNNGVNISSTHTHGGIKSGGSNTNTPS